MADCHINGPPLKHISRYSQSWIVPSQTESGFGHVSCLVQWDFSKQDGTSRDLETLLCITACSPGMFLPPWVGAQARPLEDGKAHGAETSYRSLTHPHLAHQLNSAVKGKPANSQNQEN